MVITGGAGFIGAHLVRACLEADAAQVVVIDALTYAANPDSLQDAQRDSRFRFHHLDICDGSACADVIRETQAQWVFHLAAESHVDRSIENPLQFMRTNAEGTANLLRNLLQYWEGLNREEQADFRYVQVSTDEVFGSLGDTGKFTEASPYYPNSPYAASKAAADHMARAFFQTYGFPCLLTHCGNNYGPLQFPEKLIPLVILNALEGKSLPVYGKGQNVRDWIHVEDHCQALIQVATHGQAGESYCIGADCTRSNLEVVRRISELIDEFQFTAPGVSCTTDLIQFVPDRPGHDYRYALDAGKLRESTSWRPQREFDHGLRATIEWYAANSEWVKRSRSRGYQGERLGLSHAPTSDSLS